MSAKLTVKNVYKIFGKNPSDAVRRLNAGESKEAIFEATGQTVGVQNASFQR